MSVGGQSQRRTRVSQLLDSVYGTCDRVYKIMVFVLKMGKVCLSCDQESLNLTLSCYSIHGTSVTLS